eukprot:6754746-Karenia_brevis.AAC.1
MRCPVQGWLSDVISFGTAISACEKGRQWQLVAPNPHEMPRAGPAAGRDQPRCGHLSLREGCAVEACDAEPT